MHRTPQTARNRFQLIESTKTIDRASFAADVREGLTSKNKHLPCRYIYDNEGSRLFEEICRLPEYYLTRSEREILETRLDEIVGAMPDDTALVELGSGNSEKTRILIRGHLERHGSLEYVPIDISKDTLHRNALEMLEMSPSLHITAIAAEYREGLRLAHKHVVGPECVLFLGSSIGNFDRDNARRFLRELAESIDVQDRLLVGIDLRKDRTTLEAAYDDARGVTAKFNLNILTRINRELGGQFDLNQFRHRAVYEENSGRVRSELVATEAQHVDIGALQLTASFAKGEAVHTEDSYKYSLDEIDALATACSLQTVHRWFDAKRQFSLNLFTPLSSLA